MARPAPHPRLGFLVALAICALWAVPLQYLYLHLLRESYRFGETVGITPTASSGAGTLAGQILGFNYSRPPAWYAFTAAAVSRAAALAPALAIACWVHRRLAGGRTFPVHARRCFVFRTALAIVTAGIVSATLDATISTWLWLRLITLGESLGGTVSRLSGVLAVSSDGPFLGGTAIDHLANRLARYGPVVFITTVAGAAALLLHAALWRAELLAAISGRLCTQCGYDLHATPRDARCPECGTHAAEP